MSYKTTTALACFEPKRIMQASRCEEGHISRDHWGVD